MLSSRTCLRTVSTPAFEPSARTASLVTSTGALGGADLTVSSAVIIFVRLAIGSRREAFRCHRTRPLDRSNSSPAAGGRAAVRPIERPGPVAAKRLPAAADREPDEDDDRAAHGQIGAAERAGARHEGGGPRGRLEGGRADRAQARAAREHALRADAALRPRRRGGAR